MKRVYAAQTTVSPDRSRAEIERILRRYGASKFLYGYDDRQAMIAFEAHERKVRFTLSFPGFDEFTQTQTGRHRTKSSQEQAYHQEIARRWRALALAIKAKLEVVESGIAAFEDEFLAYILLPDNHTIGQWLIPQIENIYLGGKLPPLLPSGE